MEGRVYLNQDHGWVVLAATGVAAQCYMSCVRAATMRPKLFGSAEFQRREKVQQLKDEHKKATGEEELNPGGYPDMGNGRYSEALTYKEWYEFNLAQRAHQNYLEQVCTVETFLVRDGVKVFALGMRCTSWLCYR
eukprot:gb/GECG01000222.1/.p1 GENE.gb/GECG01000222.1/~~gb/GECG01000222.1/.p1  ORF type:complete len:135 (+),score=14.07 gb/GECG01000222.1/:1-405(+)